MTLTLNPEGQDQILFQSMIMCTCQNQLNVTNNFRNIMSSVHCTMTLAFAFEGQRHTLILGLIILVCTSKSTSILLIFVRYYEQSEFAL